MDRLYQDIAYAARMLRRSPGSSLVALLTLALALGLSTSIFSLVNAISLRPLPYAAPNELVYLNSLHRETTTWSTVSALDLRDWKARSRTMADLALYDERTFGVRIGRTAEEMSGTRTSGNAFELLGAGAQLGRTLTPADDAPGAPAVVVLSHPLWRDRFDSDPGVLGRTLRIDAVEHEVVGVMPEKFGFIDFAEFWIPIPEPTYGSRGERVFNGLARLESGFTAEQAADELAVINQRLALEHPATNRGWMTHVGGVQDQRSEPFIFAIVVAGLFVLLIACANVGNLLLARGAARRGELAIRMMMGASRRRVLQQLVTESALLAGLGGIGGLLLSLWGLDLLISYLPIEQMPLWIEFGIDGRVLAFCAGALVLSVLTFGLTPALSLLKDNLGEAAQDAGRRTVGSKSATRTRNNLVIGELALSLVLLASAGLLMSGTFVSRRASSGYEPEGVLNLNVALNEQRYATPEARAAFVNDALAALSRIPGVSSSAVNGALPADRMSGSASPRSGPLTAPTAAPNTPRSVMYNAVTPAYFSTLQLPLLSGRAFSESDAESSARVVILSKTVADRLWPNADPLGRAVKLAESDRPANWLTVVGVVADRYRIAIGDEGQARTVQLDAYLPAAQGVGSTVTLALRAQNGRPATLAEAARRSLQAIDPDQPITQVRPLSEIVYDNIKFLRWIGALAGLFAGAALVLSAIGLFGVIAYAVTQRTREIGIRMALGASAAEVVAMVTTSGTRLALTGVGIGLVATLAVGRLISSVVYGISPYHPGILIGAALVLGGVAIAASWLPARRAARVSPLVALQGD